jgi:transcriptional regulator with XRE-family HTH domain
MTEISERVRELRKSQGMSQVELGEALGKGRLSITKLEQGQRAVTIEEAYALAQALGVSIIELLGERETQAEEKGVELRFEVTVKLLPSREGQPSPEEIRELIENPPPGEPQKEKVKRVFGKDKVPSKRRQKA